MGGSHHSQALFSSTVLDIINQPGLQHEIVASLATARGEDLDTFEHDTSSPWNQIRSAAFEFIRLCGTITRPAHICVEDVELRSDPALHLLKGQVATLSAYYTHRQPSAWGVNADRYVRRRFVDQDPPVGQPNFVAWGLKGAHMCPGRWFALQAISIMTKVLLDTYNFRQERVLGDDEKYIYNAGSVGRKEVDVTVTRR